MERAPNPGRREFLPGVAMTGSAAMLGLRSAWAAAAEPPPQTTRNRIHDSLVTHFAPEFAADELLKAEDFTDVQFCRDAARRRP